MAATPETPEKRVIIGEAPQAGLPVSAPIGELTRPQVVPGALRWRKTEHSFVLEQYGRLGCCGFGWYEVPCFIPEPTPATPA